MDRSLRDQYDDATVENANLKIRVQKMQNNYIQVAEDRLRVQKDLHAIVGLIGKDCQDATLCEDTFQLSKECEEICKAALLQLNEEQTQADQQKFTNSKKPQNALEDNLGKFEAQNRQLKSDLKYREKFYQLETKLKKDYLDVLDTVTEIMEEMCDDDDLVEKIIRAQVTCKANIQK